MHESSPCEVGARRAGDDKRLKIERSVEINFLQAPLWGMSHYIMFIENQVYFADKKFVWNLADTAIAPTTTLVKNMQIPNL